MIYELFAGSQRAPFAAVETAIRVVFDFHLRFDQFFPFLTNKLDVFDVQPAVQPLLFVIGLDRKNVVRQT